MGYNVKIKEIGRKTMQKRYLETGKIVTTHGIKGEVKVYPWCDDPAFLLDFQTLYLDKGKQAVVIEQARLQKQMLILKIQGVNSLEEAAKLRNRILYLDREDVELEEGAYFIQDLIGLEVVDGDSGRSYGTLSQVSQTGANDVYHILSPDKKEVLIPAIPQVILQTDLKEGKLVIRPLKGLFDDAD